LLLRVGPRRVRLPLMTNANSITDTWARSTTSRMNKGGDLYSRPLNRAEMTAPLAWHEEQLAVCRRYGVLADGSVGFEVVSR
jgi:hypothetical protein